LVIPTHAQFRESFESPDPSWKLANADCGVKVIAHKRTFEQAHDGASSEQLQFVAGRGTHLYYTLDLGRSPIIDESNFSLWLKADKARLQLLARVVLPRTVDERTGKPITALLQGEEYGDTGAWQKLQVKDLKRLLARQTVVLRKQFGSHVDPSEAYIDLLVLNAYGGAGETNVWIDDLEVLGVVDSEWAKNVAQKSSDDPPPRAAGRPAVVDGNVLLVENHPAFLRAVEHRGEPLELIKTLGFNAIALPIPPTPEQNAEARRLGLWLIAPPPDFGADSSAAVKLDRGIIWNLGQNLASQQLAATHSLVAELHGADRELRRPLLAGVKSEAWSYSREVDLLGWDVSPLFGPRSPSSFTTAARSKSAAARAGTPFLATLPVRPSAELLEQIGLLDRSSPTALAPDFEQVRLGTYAAISAGARGLIYRLPTRLDGEDEPAQQAATVIRLMNLELNLLEPWCAGSSTPQDLPTGDAALKATVLQTERSRLVLLQREQVLGQFVTPPAGSDSMQFTLRGASPSDRYYHVTPDGLRQLDRPTGGGRITVPEAGQVALVAVTQDPLVIQHLQKLTEAQRRETIETRLRLTAGRLAGTGLIAEEVRPTLQPPKDGVAMLREAQRLQAEADQLLVRGDLSGCYRNSRRVENLVIQARRLWWDAARSSFSSPLTSPCCVTFDTLPGHVRLGQRLQRGAWTKNGLPAGDCEELERLLASGWKQQRGDVAKVTGAVEISPDQPHGGAGCIRLSAKAEAGGNVVFDDAAVSVRTGSILARAGQVARFHGFVRVPQPIGGIDGSLLVYDNLAGASLAENIVHSPAWREFTLYRAVPRDGEVFLTFALAGLGEALIDDVTIELVTFQD
jgi:hypothetical protein